MKTMFAVLLVLMSLTVSAADCTDLVKCIEQVSQLTGKKYVFDAKEIRGGVQTTTNFQLSSENADSLFSYMLYLNGYARIPTTEKDTYIIINARDLRYQSVPVINVDSTTPPNVIPNYDYYMMSYKFKNYKHGQMRAAANTLRPFMSRYGRVIEAKEIGVTTIQENASILARSYEIFKKFDRELSKEEIKKAEAREKEDIEERKLERKERIKHEFDGKSDQRNESKNEPKNESGKK